MTFTYDLSTDNGKIRLQIGDVYENQAMLSDEEIAVVTGDYSNVTEAAIHCIDLALAKVSRQADSRSAAGLSASRGNQFNQLVELQTRLKRKLFASASGPVLVGPSSIDDKDTARDDTDREASKFKRDQWTNNQG